LAWSEEEVTVCDTVYVSVCTQVYARTGASAVTKRAALVLWSEDGRIKL